MLLEFRAKNYKSFKEEFVFSMIPAPKQSGLDYSILSQKIDSKKYKAISSAVIYGPNAAGKTNIIGAMDTFKSIVLRGDILNDDDKNSTYPNIAANKLELIPNCFAESTEPIDFYIKFIEDNVLVEYSFSMLIGDFLDLKFKREILSESLFINEKLIFNRNKDLEFGELKSFRAYLVNEFETNAESLKSIARNNLDVKELFLMNGFKTMFSSKLVNIIGNWLENKFMVIYRADAIEISKKFATSKRQTIYIEKSIDDAAKAFGANSNAIGYITPDEDSEVAKLCSLFDNSKGEGAAIPAEVFESYGTIRFINLFPLIATALLKGGTLVVDEFDASIHPMALMSIINIFHNDDLNKRNAQLIFNTHNPIFLNSNLFRRDEIKFVERDDETSISIHYSLSDFGTSGKSGVRKHEDYMKNYFISQYGAIKDIDFIPILEKIINEGIDVNADG